MESVRYRRPIDIAAIARAMGIPSWVVEAPGTMGATIESALAQHGPKVIEVRVDGEIMPPLGERAKTIAGFRDQ
jgi:thiamine pyrophosphate-dependent acetolactate synthase large subunit-like protein